MSVSVVHVALTPLAGSPYRIVNALNRVAHIDARLVVLDPFAYGNRTFAGDLSWKSDIDEVRELLHNADIVHLHHFFELTHNPFGVDFSRECPRARFLRQFHTHPLTIAQGDASRAEEIVHSAIPQLVIGQYHERFYPNARVVPNIVPLSHELYKPVKRCATDPTLFFAPTVDYSAASAPPGNTRWDTKGAPETEALLLNVVNGCGKGRVEIRRNIPHDQCLREKQASDIAIDEMVTGSFHLTSLEALAQGLPTFAYLDSRSLDTLSELTGTHTHPWLNFRLEEAQAPLAEMIKDGGLRREIGAFARDWMEKYYNERQMVSYYENAYKDLLECPETFDKARFDTSSRRQVFLAQQRDDLVWQSRKTRIGADHIALKAEANNAQAIRSKKTGPIAEWIKAPVHDLLKKYTSVRVNEIQALEERLAATEKLLAFVSANEINRWLYQNRLERMDATLDLFDSSRREFHLDRYRFAASRIKGKRVLDCACGTGYGVRLLREVGEATRVLGVDIEEQAIVYAHYRHQVESAHYICSAADRLPFADKSVDVVTSFETIEHVPSDVDLVEEFYRILNTEGILIVSTPNQWPLADTPHHVREYDRTSFLKVLERRFECAELYNQNSGSDTPLNHGQTRSIAPTTAANEQLAECYIAVCRRKSNK